MQSRWMSFVEAVTNIVVGYGLAVLTQIIARAQDEPGEGGALFAIENGIRGLKEPEFAPRGIDGQTGT